MSKIEWTQKTWNPTTGCTKVSAGCKNCYAEVMTRRLKGMGQEKYQAGFRVFRQHEQALHLPYTWRQPTTVFVNSMSDLFHEAASLAFVEQVFEVMNQTPQHTYQVLTKRPDVLLKFSSRLHFTPNIWMGVSVEDQRVVERIGLLRQVAAHVRFLSLEPLLGPLPGLNLEGIHWVIVGGESGHHARPVAYEWIENIRLQCEQAEIAFFFKQWGGPHKSQAGRLLNGRTYDQMPVAP